jgi:hypothetical protein
MDSTGNTRTGSIVKINGNPSGYNGGYFSQITYMDGTNYVTCNESGSAGDLSGLGFMVDHVPSGTQLPAGYAGRGWINSKQDGTGGTTSIIFQGANHIIYETEMNEYGDDSQHGRGTWKVKWRYMIRTGNDYIVDSISYDFSSQPAGTWGNDIRSPYCEFNWSGTGASNTLTEPIDGVEFCAADNTGSSWIFKTIGSSPFTGGYSYNTPGRNIPYTRQWLNSPDREIGYISTLDMTQWAAGGGYLSGPVNIGSTSASMPPSWAINYQSNGFQNWMGDKMTWGLPYGAAGGETALESGSTAMSVFPDWTWRKNWNAYPVVGFTLLIQIGKSSSDKVHSLTNEEADIHGLAQNSLTASNGTVVTTGQSSLYDSSAFTLKPAGYNHMNHSWEVQCNSNQADVILALGAVSLENQTFIFDDYTSAAAPAVTLNGISLNDGVDMFTSVDTVNKQLYITFNRTFTGSEHIVAGGLANTPTFTDTVPAGSTSTFTQTFTPTPTPQPAGCLFDNLEDMDANNSFGGYWYSYFGGAPATVWPSVGTTLTPSAGGANSTSYAMRVTGTVGVAGTTYPCVGMGSQLTASSGSPSFTEMNLSSCTGMTFYTKGNGSSYLVKIPYTDTAGNNLTGYNDYNYSFTAPASWTQLTVPFASMSQAATYGTTYPLSIVLQHAKEIQWQSNFNAIAPATSAPVDLWIDEVYIYGCSSCPPGQGSPTSTSTFTATKTPTNTPTFTASFTVTDTPPPGSTSTYTPTITPTFAADCVSYTIDRSAVPAEVFMKNLTIIANIGDCTSATVFVDGSPVPATYTASTKEIMFTTSGTNVIISRLGYTGNATYVVTKATLYNNFKWAYSFTCDDGRPTTNTVVMPMFSAYGYVGGSALNTANMQQTGDGYVMSWASADNLKAHGWSFFDHNYSHQNVTCANISTETVPDKNSIDARWPGYTCTHFVYPYCDTTYWTCIRDSGLFLSAEDNNGNNYADVLPTNLFILNRNSFFAAGNAGTAALANALADNAAADSRPRWMIMFAHEVVPGSGTPTTTYDTNEATLGAHISYVYNTYGAGGNNTMWFAPSDVVMQYMLTRNYTVVNMIGNGLCGAITPATPSSTYTPTNTPIVTPTSSVVCSFDNMEDQDNTNNYGGFWYAYSGGTPATVWPGVGTTLTPSAGGANGTNYAMRVTGTVGVAGTTYPCVGMGSQFTATGGAPNFTELNISSCLGMRFYAKGNGSSYLVKIPYTDTAGVSLTGYNDYNYTFIASATWTQLAVPFASMSQATTYGTTYPLSTVLQHAKEIQWQSNFNATAPATSAPVDLWVDEIVIYGCASCPAMATATFTPAAGTATFTGTPTTAVTGTFTTTNTPTLTNTATFTGTYTNTATFTATATNTFTFTWTPSLTPTSVSNPNITSSILQPASAVVGQNITVTMSVFNNGTVDTSNIIPSVLTPSVYGVATLLQGPTPSSAGITMGNTVTFTWVYAATAPSAGLTFSGNASGTYGAGSPMASSVTSGNATALLAPTDTATTVPPTNTFSATFTASATSTPVNTNTLTATCTPAWTFTSTPTQTPAAPTSTFTPTISNIFEIATLTPVIIFPNPNPTPGVIQDRMVKFTLSQPASKVEFRLYTSMSRLVRRKEIDKTFSQGEQVIDIDRSYFDGLGRGTYFYILIATDSAGSMVKKSPIEKALVW